MADTLSEAIPVFMTPYRCGQINTLKMDPILGYSGPYRLAHLILGTSRGEMCRFQVQMTGTDNHGSGIRILEAKCTGFR